VMLCCLLLVFSLTGLAFSSPANDQPEIVIIGPEMQTYDLDAVQWEIPLTLTAFGPGTQTARLAEFSINGHDLLQLVPKPQRTLPVHRLDNEIGREDFRKWNDYRKRAAILRVRSDERIYFSPAEEQEFREGSSRMKEIKQKRREIAPVTLAVDVANLPFQVAADGLYTVRAVVERGQKTAVWEGDILIVDVEPVDTNPFWVPADLHIHSTYADDGRFTPVQLAPMLVSRGYQIAYITDEPAGWGITRAIFPPRMSGSGDASTNAFLKLNHPYRGNWLPWLATWETYSSAVRSASTTQVAMFPGAEISASNVNQAHTGEHRGHALAYGIQNLTGSATFDAGGLRYSWFRPNNLLNNINNNRIGTSSAAIAHPTGSYPWTFWTTDPPHDNITARYDGFELMTALQTQFGPNSSPVVRWRSELVARLPGVFGDDAGFPSARTGSDWGGLGSEFY
ncbi:MAG: hypothetical protein KGZ50_10710, partial [Peptococcaceae bacterium]|nr:hypothetical protein [Peptococcaceae bacterium]